MVRGAEVVVAPVLFYIDCSSCLSETSEAILDGLNWHLLGVSFWGESPMDSQILMVVGLTDSHMDALGPLAFIWHSVMAQAISCTDLLE